MIAFMQIFKFDKSSHNFSSRCLYFLRKAVNYKENRLGDTKDTEVGVCRDIMPFYV